MRSSFHRRQPWLTLTATTLVVALGLPGAARSQESPAIPETTFVMALAGSPQSFDPRDMVRAIESRVINNLFEGLYMAPMGEGPAVPAVALGHEVSDDGTLYTFHLRPEARWSNGDPVTAQDFVTAWLRVLEPGTDYPYAYLMYGLQNGRAYAAGEATADQVGVRAADEHTLVVELEEPVAFFTELTAFATFFPVHSASVAAHGEEAFTAENLVSNGPYEIASFDPESELRLAKNPSYWDAASLSIDTVVMRIFPDEDAGLEAYLSGQVEWLDELPWQRLSSLRFREDFHTHPMFGTYYFRVNVTDPVFSDPRVRQALSLSIDRRAICQHVLDGLCTPADSFVPPMPDFEPVGMLPYDPDLARELLFEAGYDGGEGFPRVRLYYSTLELHQRIVEAVQEMWRANLGIEVEPIEYSWDNYLEALENMDYHVARFGWIGDYLDPDSFLYLMVGENANMNSGWHSFTYDALMRQASTEADQQRRFELFRAAEAILLTELPVIPLFYYTQYQLIRPEVRGFEMNLRDVHLVRYITKAPAAASDASGEETGAATTVRPDDESAAELAQ